MTAADEREMQDVREHPRLWFQGFGRYRDEQTRQPTRGKANVLQRRAFEHYHQCLMSGIPCRMVMLKYRRAGSSTAGSALIYTHAQNFTARLGVIGTDYKASSNMLDMVKFYGQHDDFPGWSVRASAARGEAAASSAELKRSAPTVSETRKVGWQEFYAGQPLESVPWEDRIERQIATRIDFAHDSTVELYTSKNPESARSAGLNGYLATECGRWQTGGEQDAGETLTAMRNTLPKAGFHIAIEESTANGAQGAFYETCRAARWPDAPWTRQFETRWQLTPSQFGKELQFVFVFAAWFEDSRHVEKITPEQEASIRDTLTESEKTLISRFGQDGPRGQRLGAEVDATVWEQLAWRRGIIANVCVKAGEDEFKTEYPSSPEEAFRASGSPALDQEGLTAMEEAARVATPPEGGEMSLQAGGTVAWHRVAAQQAVMLRWEEPIVGCRYVVSCDPMTGADQVTGTGQKDNHAVFVLRDAYRDTHGQYNRVKVVARLKPPCQWEDEFLSPILYRLSLHYGGALIVVEGNCGAAILKTLHNDLHANVYQREEVDTIRQKVTLKLGYWTDRASKRILIATLQQYVREQMLECLCLHAIGEMQTLIVDSKGLVCASGTNHDDDPMGIALGLECLPHAHKYADKSVRNIRRDPPDLDHWKIVG